MKTLKKAPKLFRDRYAKYIELRKAGESAKFSCRRAVEAFPTPPKSAAQLAIESNDRNMEAFRKQGMLIRANKAAINRAYKVASRYGEPSVYTSSGRVQISVYIRNLDSLKRGKLPRALTALSRATGVEFDSTSDYAASGNRDFSGSNSIFRVMVCAYLKTDAKACRKVPTGSRTETVIEYKLVCED